MKVTIYMLDMLGDKCHITFQIDNSIKDGVVYFLAYGCKEWTSDPGLNLGNSMEVWAKSPYTMSGSHGSGGIYHKCNFDTIRTALEHLSSKGFHYEIVESE